MNPRITTLCIKCHHAENHFAQCRIKFIFVLNVIMPSVFMLNVIMPNVFMLKVILLSVMMQRTFL
jgi:hypothetical protein